MHHRRARRHDSRQRHADGGARRGIVLAVAPTELEERRFRKIGGFRQPPWRQVAAGQDDARVPAIVEDVDGMHRSARVGRHRLRGWRHAGDKPKEADQPREAPEAVEQRTHMLAHHNLQYTNICRRATRELLSHLPPKMVRQSSQE